MNLDVHGVAKMGEIRREITIVRTVPIATVIIAFNCTTNFIENTQSLVKAMSTTGQQPPYWWVPSSGVRSIRERYLSSSVRIIINSVVQLASALNTSKTARLTRNLTLLLGFCCIARNNGLLIIITNYLY